MHPAHESLLEEFEYHHLPEGLQEVSKQFHHLAHKLVSDLGETRKGAELTTGLRKLLEAKDCAVRAAKGL